MEGKTKIVIEQYDKGITVNWSNSDGDTRRFMALDGEQGESIGEILWDEIESVLDACGADKLTIHYEYEVAD